MVNAHKVNEFNNVGRYRGKGVFAHVLMALREWIFSSARSYLPHYTEVNSELHAPEALRSGKNPPLSIYEKAE